MKTSSHSLSRAAEINVEASAELLKRGRGAQARQLLHAALSLADLSKDRQLTRKIEKALAALPQVDPVPDPLKTKLYELLDKLGDLYGQEATGDGELFETEADNVVDAGKQCLPDVKKALVDPSDFATFKRLRGTKWHKELVKVATPLQPEYALIGDEEVFNPTGSDRGGFYHCLLLKTKETLGKNLLIAFDCAET